MMTFINKKMMYSVIVIILAVILVCIITNINQKHYSTVYVADKVSISLNHQEKGTNNIKILNYSNANLKYCNLYIYDKDIYKKGNKDNYNVVYKRNNFNISGNRNIVIELDENINDNNYLYFECYLNNKKTIENKCWWYFPITSLSKNLNNM